MEVDIVASGVAHIWWRQLTKQIIVTASNINYCETHRLLFQSHKEDTGSLFTQHLIHSQLAYQSIRECSNHLGSISMEIKNKKDAMTPNSIAVFNPTINTNNVNEN